MDDFFISGKDNAPRHTPVTPDGGISSRQYFDKTRKMQTHHSPYLTVEPCPGHVHWRAYILWPSTKREGAPLCSRACVHRGKQLR